MIPLMPFFLKSVISLILVLTALTAYFTMFELFGRAEKRFNPNILKTIHRINGYFFITVFVFVSFFCLKYVWATKASLSPRAALHALLAIATLLVFLLKVSMVRIYRRYLPRVQVLGMTLVLLSFGVVATSAGYFFLISGEDRVTSQIEPPTELELTAQGERIFRSKCNSCHNDQSTQTIIGPGLKGILKRKRLPISGRAATPDNVVRQLKTPYKAMPFLNLSEEEISALLAYLKTL